MYGFCVRWERSPISKLSKKGRNKGTKVCEVNFKRYFVAVVVNQSHQEFKCGTLRMCMRTPAVIPPARLRMRVAYTWRAQKINDPAQSWVRLHLSANELRRSGIKSEIGSRKRAERRWSENLAGNRGENFWQEWERSDGGKWTVRVQPRWRRWCIPAE